MYARYLVLAAAGLVVACGSSSSRALPASPLSPSGPNPPPLPAPAPTPTVTITSSGFSPLEIEVPIGGRVTFVNTDRLGHEIASGLEHNAPDCREVDRIGFLVQGESRETSVFEEAKTCRVHDHSHIGDPAFQGRIVIR